MWPYSLPAMTALISVAWFLSASRDLYSADVNIFVTCSIRSKALDDSVGLTVDIDQRGRLLGGAVEGSGGFRRRFPIISPG